MVLDKIRTGLVASPWHNRQISPGSSSRQHADGAGEAEAGNIGRGHFAHNLHVRAVPSCTIVH